MPSEKRTRCRLRAVPSAMMEPNLNKNVQPEKRKRGRPKKVSSSQTSCEVITNSVSRSVMNSPNVGSPRNKSTCIRASDQVFVVDTEENILPEYFTPKMNEGNFTPAGTIITPDVTVIDMIPSSLPGSSPFTCCSDLSRSPTKEIRTFSSLSCNKYVTKKSPCREQNKYDIKHSRRNWSLISKNALSKPEKESGLPTLVIRKRLKKLKDELTERDAKHSNSEETVSSVEATFIDLFSQQTNCSFSESIKIDNSRKKCKDKSCADASGSSRSNTIPKEVVNKTFSNSEASISSQVKDKPTQSVKLKNSLKVSLPLLSADLIEKYGIPEEYLPSPSQYITRYNKVKNRTSGKRVSSIVTADMPHSDNMAPETNVKSNCMKVKSVQKICDNVVKDAESVTELQSNKPGLKELALNHKRLSKSKSNSGSKDQSEVTVEKGKYKIKIKYSQDMSNENKKSCSSLQVKDYDQVQVTYCEENDIIKNHHKTPKVMAASPEKITLLKKQLEMQRCKSLRSKNLGKQTNKKLLEDSNFNLKSHSDKIVEKDCDKFDVDMSCNLEGDSDIMHRLDGKGDNESSLYAIDEDLIDSTNTSDSHLTTCDNLSSKVNLGDGTLISDVFNDGLQVESVEIDDDDELVNLTLPEGDFGPIGSQEKCDPCDISSVIEIFSPKSKIDSIILKTVPEEVVSERVSFQNKHVSDIFSVNEVSPQSVKENDIFRSALEAGFQFESEEDDDSNASGLDGPLDDAGESRFFESDNIINRPFTFEDFKLIMDCSRISNITVSGTDKGNGQSEEVFKEKENLQDEVTDSHADGLIDTGCKTVEPNLKSILDMRQTEVIVSDNATSAYTAVMDTAGDHSEFLKNDVSLVRKVVSESVSYQNKHTSDIFSGNEVFSPQSVQENDIVRSALEAGFQFESAEEDDSNASDLDGPLDDDDKIINRSFMIEDLKLIMDSSRISNITVSSTDKGKRQSEEVLNEIKNLQDEVTDSHAYGLIDTGCEPVEPILKSNLDMSQTEVDGSALLSESTCEPVYIIDEDHMKTSGDHLLNEINMQLEVDDIVKDDIKTKLFEEDHMKPEGDHLVDEINMQGEADVVIEFANVSEMELRKDITCHDERDNCIKLLSSEVNQVIVSDNATSAYTVVTDTVGDHSEFLKNDVSLVRNGFCSSNLLQSCPLGGYDEPDSAKDQMILRKHTDNVSLSPFNSSGIGGYQLSVVDTLYAGDTIENNQRLESQLDITNESVNSVVAMPVYHPRSPAQYSKPLANEAKQPYHLQSLNQTDRVDNDNVMHQCSVCNKRFKSLAKVLVHLKYHDHESLSELESDGDKHQVAKTVEEKNKFFTLKNILGAKCVFQNEIDLKNTDESQRVFEMQSMSTEPAEEIVLTSQTDISGVKSFQTEMNTSSISKLKDKKAHKKKSKKKVVDSETVEVLDIDPANDTMMTCPVCRNQLNRADFHLHKFVCESNLVSMNTSLTNSRHTDSKHLDGDMSLASPQRHAVSTITSHVPIFSDSDALSDASQASQPGLKVVLRKVKMMNTIVNGESLKFCGSISNPVWKIKERQKKKILPVDTINVKCSPAQNIQVNDAFDSKSDTQIQCDKNSNEGHGTAKQVTVKSSDILQGSKGSDIIQGSKGSNILQGSKGSGILQGSNGSNILQGKKFSQENTLVIAITDFEKELLVNDQLKKKEKLKKKSRTKHDKSSCKKDDESRVTRKPKLRLDPTDPVNGEVPKHFMRSKMARKIYQRDKERQSFNSEDGLPDFSNTGVKLDSLTHLVVGQSLTEINNNDRKCKTKEDNSSKVTKPSKKSLKKLKESVESLGILQKSITETDWTDDTKNGFQKRTYSNVDSSQPFQFYKIPKLDFSGTNSNLLRTASMFSVSDSKLSPGTGCNTEGSSLSANSLNEFEASTVDNDKTMFTELQHTSYEPVGSLTPSAQVYSYGGFNFTKTKGGASYYSFQDQWSSFGVDPSHEMSPEKVAYGFVPNPKSASVFSSTPFQGHNGTAGEHSAEVLNISQISGINEKQKTLVKRPRLKRFVIEDEDKRVVVKRDHTNGEGGLEIVTKNEYYKKDKDAEESWHRKRSLHKSLSMSTGESSLDSMENQTNDSLGSTENQTNEESAYLGLKKTFESLCQDIEETVNEESDVVADTIVDHSLHTEFEPGLDEYLFENGADTCLGHSIHDEFESELQMDQLHVQNKTDATVGHSAAYGHTEFESELKMEELHVENGAKDHLMELDVDDFLNEACREHDDLNMEIDQNDDLTEERTLKDVIVEEVCKGMEHLKNGVKLNAGHRVYENDDYKSESQVHLFVIGNVSENKHERDKDDTKQHCKNDDLDGNEYFNNFSPENDDSDKIIVGKNHQNLYGNVETPDMENERGNMYIQNKENDIDNEKFEIQTNDSILDIPDSDNDSDNSIDENDTVNRESGLINSETIDSDRSPVHDIEDDTDTNSETNSMVEIDEKIKTKKSESIELTEDRDDVLVLCDSDMDMFEDEEDEEEEEQKTRPNSTEPSACETKDQVVTESGHNGNDSQEHALQQSLTNRGSNEREDITEGEKLTKWEGQRRMKWMPLGYCFNFCKKGRCDKDSCTYQHSLPSPNVLLQSFKEYMDRNDSETCLEILRSHINIHDKISKSQLEILYRRLLPNVECYWLLKIMNDRGMLDQIMIDSYIRTFASPQFSHYLYAVFEMAKGINIQFQKDVIGLLLRTFSTHAAFLDKLIAVLLYSTEDGNFVVPLDCLNVAVDGAIQVPRFFNQLLPWLLESQQLQRLNVDLKDRLNDALEGSPLSKETIRKLRELLTQVNHVEETSQAQLEGHEEEEGDSWSEKDEHYWLNNVLSVKYSKDVAYLATLYDEKRSRNIPFNTEECCLYVKAIGGDTSEAVSLLSDFFESVQNTNSYLSMKENPIAFNKPLVMIAFGVFELCYMEELILSCIGILDAMRNHSLSPCIIDKFLLRAVCVCIEAQQSKFAVELLKGANFDTMDVSQHAELIGYFNSLVKQLGTQNMRDDCLCVVKWAFKLIYNGKPNVIEWESLFLDLPIICANLINAFLDLKNLGSAVDIYRLIQQFGQRFPIIAELELKLMDHSIESEYKAVAVNVFEKLKKVKYFHQQTFSTPRKIQILCRTCPNIYISSVVLIHVEDYLMRLYNILCDEVMANKRLDPKELHLKLVIVTLKDQTNILKVAKKVLETKLNPPLYSTILDYGCLLINPGSLQNYLSELDKKGRCQGLTFQNKPGPRWFKQQQQLNRR